MDDNQRPIDTTATAAAAPTPAAPSSPPSPSVEEYVRIYRDHHQRLVGYARTLTGNAWLAEDLTAEAHFRVWRRISGGHPVEDIPAYLAATIRNLHYTVHGADQELPQDPQVWPAAAATDDPGQRVAYTALLTEVLGQLPRRWARALWLAEVEDLSPDGIGAELGTNANAASALLHRAREGMRQAFLRVQPGRPRDQECGRYWERMPAFVRGVAPDRQAEWMRDHATWCADCRGRLLALEHANRRLPVLVGPALLALLATGTARFLLVGAGAGTGSRTVAAAARGRHALRHGGGTARKAALAGAAAVVLAGGLAMGLTGGGEHPTASAAIAPPTHAATGASGAGKAAGAAGAHSAKGAGSGHGSGSAAGSGSGSGSTLTAQHSTSRQQPAVPAQAPTKSQPGATAPSTASTPTAHPTTRSAPVPTRTSTPAPTGSTAPTVKPTPAPTTSTTPAPKPTTSPTCLQLALLGLCVGGSGN